MKKISERKRIILVESNLWGSPSPTSCSEHALLEDVALSHTQLGSECLQGWRFQIISGKLLPVFDHPPSASIFSLLFSKTLALLQLKISFPSKGSSKSRKKTCKSKIYQGPGVQALETSVVKVIMSERPPRKGWQRKKISGYNRTYCAMLFTAHSNQQPRIQPQ